VAKRWVINASPLIVLCSIQYEHLLFRLADEIVVPRAVANEIAQGPSEDKARQLLSASHFQVVNTPTAPVELLTWDLGAGETAVLAHAIANPEWTAILDDGAARRCAKSFSVPVKGTLGIVILARQRGLISSASSVLRQLLNIGFRLDDRVISEALQRTVGEEWR
jgi:predicted nucleic acid-binding protein